VQFQGLGGLLKTKFLEGDTPSGPWLRWLALIVARFNASLVVVPIPASATAKGTPNECAIDRAGGWFYLCVAQDVWLRSPLSTF
jgi:hypothetical protein